MGFPISIPGVRNVLQSQEVFLMDAKSNFFNFEDREESNISHCMYFEREIHWCTQNHLWTSSSMHQKDYLMNMFLQIYFCPFFEKLFSHLNFCQSWGTFLKPREVRWVNAGVRIVLQSQEEFLKDDKIYFFQFLSYREVWYINLYVLC